jgi:hypothetical protein
MLPVWIDGYGTFDVTEQQATIPIASAITGNFLR